MLGSFRRSIDRTTAGTYVPGTVEPIQPVSVSASSWNCPAEECLQHNGAVEPFRLLADTSNGSFECHVQVGFFMQQGRRCLGQNRGVLAAKTDRNRRWFWPSRAPKNGDIHAIAITN